MNLSAENAVFVCVFKSKTTIMHMDYRPFGRVFIQFMAIYQTYSSPRITVSFLIRLSFLILGVRNVFTETALTEFECEMLNPFSPHLLPYYYPNQIILPSEKRRLQHRRNALTNKEILYTKWQLVKLWADMLTLLNIHVRTSSLWNNFQTNHKSNPTPFPIFLFSKHKAGYDVNELCI